MTNKLLFSVILFLLNVYYVNANGKIKMIFRYDDYALIPSQFNDSLFNIFEKNNIPLCVGIIPFYNDSVLINQLNQDQINNLISRIKRNEIEVSLHGFDHSNNMKSSFLKRKYNSEFATVNYDDQYKKLEKGKRIIDSLLKINIKVFSPPFNTYDDNTLKALADLGFEIISGTMAGAYSCKKINYMPVTVTHEGFSELPSIINRYKNDDLTIILYFHSYSFKKDTLRHSRELSKRITFNQLDVLLQWVKHQNVSFRTYTGLAKYENFGYNLFKANFLRYNLLKKTLNKLKLYRYGVYSPLEFHTKHKELFLGNILLHLLSFVLVYFFVTWLIKMFHPRLSTVISILLIFLFLILFYLYYVSSDKGFLMKFIILSVIFLATLTGIFRKFRRGLSQE